MEKVNVSCRIAAEDVAFLDKLAETLERDRSYLIQKAVSGYVAFHRCQIVEVENAVKEADAGDFATDKQARNSFADLRG